MGFITLFGSEKPRDPTIAEKVRNAVSRTKRDLSERLSDLIEGRREIVPGNPRWC